MATATETQTESRPTITAADYNLLAPEVRANPYPYYAVLRRDSPVHQMMPGVPMYTITRYEDVTRILHDPDTFSSTAFQAVIQGGVGFGPNQGALAGHPIFETGMMITVDPPDHTRLRGIVNRGFTPRRIQALEPRLREIAAGYVKRNVKGAARMDLMPEMAIPFPVTVIAELLGVETGDRDQFKHWSDTIVIGLSGMSGDVSPDDLRRCADEMTEYFQRVAAERRAQPKEDLVSVLVQAQDGDGLTDAEVVAFALLLLIAGNETTTNLIGNAMRALVEHPEQLDSVYEDRTLIPGMLEEALRYDSPIQGFPRKVMKATEIRGIEIPENSFLMTLFGSANRDEKQFSDPERFDVHRNPQGHLAFGHGVHFCLGASLARLEAKIAFETLFELRGKPRLDGEIELIDSLLLRGPKTLPLAF